MIPYKVFFPSVGAIAALALGLVLVLTRVPLGWSITITSAVTLLVVVVVERLIHVVDVFTQWTLDARSIAFRMIAAAILADGGITVMLECKGLPDIPPSLLYLAGIAVVQIVISWVADHYLVRLRPRIIKNQLKADKVKSAELVVAQNALQESESKKNTVEESQDVLKMRKALKMASLGWLVITKDEPLSDGELVFGKRFDVQITAQAMSSKKKKSLSMEDAEPIAVALSELLGQDLETRWVGVQKLRRAGGYSITVTTQDIMARIYPYIDSPEWGDITEPAPVGYGLDAKITSLSLRQHGQFLGMTRSGKTSLVNCTMAYGLRCRNAVYWVCGTMKLYDILAGWLEIYLDTGVEMPFDWVMAGPQDTAEMLAALLRIGRYRQSLRQHLRKDLPDIICVLDEASFALQDTTVTAIVGERDLTMSQLCADIAKGIGSAGCWLHYATQRDTNDQLGPSGGDTQAQTGFTAFFSTQDSLAVGRQLKDFQLPPVVHKGEYYLKTNDGDIPYPRILKAPYIQETDPSKPRLHDGVTLSDISWSRRNFKTRLDIGSQRAAGELYLNRQTLVTEEFLDYLADPTSSFTPSGGGAPVKNVAVIDTPATDREAIELASKMGLDFSTMPAAEKEAFREVAKEMCEDITDDVPEQVVGTRADQIVHILREAGISMTSSEIMNHLRGAGHDLKSGGAVYNLLRQLTEDGIIVKDADRKFSLPDSH